MSHSWKWAHRKRTPLKCRWRLPGPISWCSPIPPAFRALAVLVDYYISPSTAAPTATPTPAPTVSLDGSTDSNSTTPSTQAASLSIPFSGSEILFIPSQNSELIELDLNAGDTLKVSYSGYGAQIGTARTALPVPVDFLILDPANEPLLEVGGLVENSVDVQVEISGIHRLVFTNPARLRALAVLVDYYIKLPRQQPQRPRQPPLSTVSLDGSTDSRRRPPLRLPASPSPFGPEILFIPSQNSEPNAGDTLKVYLLYSVAVIGTSTDHP